MRIAFLACLLFGIGNIELSAQRVDAELKASAIRFIQTLTDLQKKRALLSFADSSRTTWDNLPVGLRARSGINMGSLTDDQKKLVHRLLSASLSSQGYLKATGIMHLDNLINLYFDTLHQRKTINDRMYQAMRNLQWSHQNFYLAIFGKPDQDSAWGFKIEGHHLSLNFVLNGNRSSVTPMFLGTDPAEYPILDYAGWRVLSKEEDYGIRLINMLNEKQQKQATMSTDVPGDIITSAQSGKRLVDEWGIKGSSMNKMQQETMKAIIREFVFNLRYEKADEEYQKILKAGIGNIYFGWIGSYDETKPHYYILNGPGFLIEFDNNNGPGRMANHIHAIWREKGNEYGEDMLKKHYSKEHNPKN